MPATRPSYGGILSADMLRTPGQVRRGWLAAARTIAGRHMDLGLDNPFDTTLERAGSLGPGTVARPHRLEHYLVIREVVHNAVPYGTACSFLTRIPAPAASRYHASTSVRPESLFHRLSPRPRSVVRMLFP